MTFEEIGRRLSDDLGQVVKIEPMGDAKFKTEVPDATDKFRVFTSTGQSFFLLVSGAGNPQLMNRAVENIRTVCMNVSSGIADRILQPVTTGKHEHMTYAVWALKRPFPSTGRLQRLLARRRYAEPVLNWSASLTRETLKDGDSTTFLADLQQIHDEKLFPHPMRQDALLSQARIHSGVWNPKHCLHHGDFWTGNILLPNGPQEPSFYVIDWAGMQSNGYPFLDLARMLISMRSSSRFSAYHIEELRDQVGCDHRDVISYTLSALGHIGRNLEHFPPDRYRSMAVKVYDFMKSH